LAHALSKKTSDVRTSSAKQAVGTYPQLICPHLNKKPPIWPGTKKTFFRDFADPNPAPSGGMAAMGR